MQTNIQTGKVNKKNGKVGTYVYVYPNFDILKISDG